MAKERHTPATRDPNAQLTDALRNVRNRWRFAVALRGLVVVLGASLLVFVAVALVMDALRYSPSAVLAARVLVWTAVVALAARFLALPLTRRIPDERVALYMEEREPTLDAAVVTAVQYGQADAISARPAHSSALGRKLVDSAVARVHRLDDGRRIERPRITREGGVLAALVVAGVASLVLGPASLRHGARMLIPWGTAEAASPYRLAVRPGNVTLPRGGDIKIETRLHGFQSERVELVVKQADSSSWTRIAMSAEGDSSGYVTRLFDVTQRTEYYVETGGVRSPTYRIDVTDLPYSKRIDLEYRYPAYTGRPPEVVENGGDIATLRGTLVTVRVTPTRPAPAGRLVIEGGAPVALTADSAGVLAGVLRVDKPGFYKVELEGPNGRMLAASLDYTIDVLDDRGPTVRLAKPGRDMKATAVEEVFVEAVAQDDHGISSLELLYSVNGGPEQRRVLSAPRGAARETSGSHTFLLEELTLEAGDVISYYARATDNNRLSAAQTASTDIYFLEIRPFAQDYRQQQQGGGGGGGGGGEDPGKLSKIQREIIAGTFKMERDRKTLAAKQFQEDVATIALAQSRLREQADGLARRLVERGIAGQDTNYAKIAEILPKAVAEMRTAEATLGRRDTKGALAPEQRALAHLQRAEAVFREIQVSMGGEGGGGGGGEQQNAEDLADLFELERDKMRNQYEAVERGRQEQQQQTDNQVDEALERLKQLASRQQQENERLRRKADSLRAQQGNTQGGGGAGQRQLAEQAEETARQLERLAREQSSPALAESARRLQDAADAMRRSASTDGARALADANAALDRLKDARRLLDREREGRASRDASDAVRTARELAEEQRRVAEVQRQLGDQPGAGGAERARALSERKGALADRVRDFKSQLDRSAMDTRRDQPETARRMQEAANSLRDRKTEEKIRHSRGLIGAGDPEQARSLESQITADLDSTAKTLERAAASANASGSRREGEALDRARDLVRGLSSLDERMKEREERAGQRPGEEQPRDGRQNQQGGQQPGQQQSGRLQDGPPQPNQSQGGGPPNAAQTGPPRGRSSGAPMTTEEIRQYQRELRERLAEAEALRRDLRAQGRDVAQLDRLIGQLRGLGGAVGSGASAAEIASLRASLVEGFKAYEFALRRDVEGSDKERLLLGRSGDVPEGFKQMVEEYYKSLAGQKPRR